MKPCAFFCVLLFACQAWAQVEDDDFPIFIKDMDGFSISEDTPDGSKVYTLEASHPRNKSVTFKMEADMFEIRDPASGDVYLTRKLDFESEKELKVKVTASDDSTPPNELPRDITVNVLDANDNVPAFTLELFEATVRESAPPNTTVYGQNWADVRVTDVDPSQKFLTVACVPVAQYPDGCEKFSLRQTIPDNNLRWQGVVVSNGGLDYETRAVYQISLEAFDGVHTAKRTMEIKVEDVQDSPPIFQSGLSADVDEERPAGTIVTTVKAVDGDSGQRRVCYDIVKNVQGMFSMDRSRGTLVTTGPIDREDPTFAQGFVAITVRAAELITGSNCQSGVVGEGPIDSVEADITITITDINDNCPRFTKDSWDVDVSESIKNGTRIADLQLRVADRDSDANAQFTIELETLKSVFSVSPSSALGEALVSISVIDSQALDYDAAVRTLSLRVVARETGIVSGVVCSSAADVRINIRDANDNTPTFSQTSYSAGVSETAAPGTLVTTIKATDVDAGTFGTGGLRYTLAQNTGANRFMVDPITGRITVATCSDGAAGKAPCLDYEEQETYELTYGATDNGGTGNLKLVQLTVTLRDANDNPPVFEIRELRTRMLEGTREFQDPIFMKATDADGTLDNRRVRYSFVSGNEARQFNVNPSSGELTIVRDVRIQDAPNEDNSFTLVIQASDGTFTDQATVIVFVQDANDHPPVFTQNGFYNFKLSETASPGDDVGKVTATDADPPNSPNGVFSYQISSGAKDKFRIDSDTGGIVVAPGASFDYDTEASYRFQVIATDQGTPVKSGSAQVTVDLIDMNNRAPYLVPSTKEAWVAENVTVGHLVETLVGRDADKDARLEFSFSTPIQAFTPQGLEVKEEDYPFKSMLTLDKISGEVRTARALNHEAVSSLFVPVLVTDTASDPVGTGTGTLIVRVQDINDQAPVFAAPWTRAVPEYGVEMAEEQPLGTSVITLVAADPDGRLVTYKMGANPQGAFRLNPATGQVSLTARLDYEDADLGATRTFTVVARDDGVPMLESSAHVTVTLTNINDNNPAFDQPYYEFAVEENKPGPLTAAVVKASDDDAGVYGDLTFSAQPPLFLNTNGVVELMEPLDREEISQLVTSITACDSPGDDHAAVRRCSSVPVYIKVNDMNDNSPILRRTNFSVTVLTSEPPESVIAHVIASDADTPPLYGNVSFTIAGGEGLFSVNKIGQVSLVRKLTADQAGTYRLTVEARDEAGSGPNAATAYITVNVVVKDNVMPFWIIPAYNNSLVSFKENKFEGSLVLGARAQDEDRGTEGEVSYHFLRNGQLVLRTPEFDIRRDTGTVTSRVTFDREASDTYELYLVAVDGGVPPLRNVRHVTVKIEDVNDNDPVFPQYPNGTLLPYWWSVSENAGNVTLVGQLKATDADLGQFADVYYYITGDSVSGNFRCNEETGEVYTVTSLDYEQRSTYSFTAIATNQRRNSDGSFPGPVSSSTTSLVINVRDANDEPPVFLQAVYYSCVPIESDIGRRLLQVKAVDNDAGNAAVSYSLSGQRVTAGGERLPTPGAFSVDEKSGEVSLRTLVSNYGGGSFFDFNVNAFDGTYSKAAVYVVVVEKSDRLVLTFNDSPNDVSSKLPLIVGELEDQLDSHICVDAVTYNAADFSRTDLYFYAIAKTAPTPAVRAYSWGWQRLQDKFVLGGTMAQVAGGAADDEDLDLWLLIPVILGILLLLLLLLLLILCCCCPSCGGPAARFRSKSAFAETTTQYYYPPGMQKVNPLWGGGYQDNMAFENDMHETSFSHTADMKRSNLSLSAAGLKVTDLDDTLVGRVGLEASAATMARLRIGGGQQNGGVTQRQELTTRQQYMEENERRMQAAAASNNYLAAGTQQQAIGYDTAGAPDGAYALEGGADYVDGSRDRTYSRSTVDNVFHAGSVASGPTYGVTQGQTMMMGTGVSTAMVGTGISTGIVPPSSSTLTTSAVDGSLAQPLNYAGTQSITLLPDAHEGPRTGEAVTLNFMTPGATLQAPGATMASPRSASMGSMGGSTSGGQTFHLEGGSVSQALDTTPRGSTDNLAHTAHRIDTLVLE